MKRQALVNTILGSVGGKIQAEVGSLLGCQIAVSTPTISTVSKEEFFSQSLKKMALTHLDAGGDREGKGYLFVQVKDSILLGGTLIMLPPPELEARIGKEELSEEDTDAFGEIGNIIAGVLTSTFDEYFPEKLRFVKKGIETVVPSKVRVESPEPIPDGMYCQAAYSLSMEGAPLNPIQLLFPSDLLGLTPAAHPSASAPKAAGGNQAAGLAEAFAPKSSENESGGQFIEASPLAGGEQVQEGSTVKAQEEGAAPPAGIVQAKMDPREPTVLVIAEDPSEGGSFAEVLLSKGFQVRKLAMKDDVRGVLTGDDFKGVFLVMREVNEQGFAAAIRVKSAGGSPVPLIAAGPHWTRKTVLQAVRYGICDIVMTPATSQEIGEKVERHMMKATA